MSKHTRGPWATHLVDSCTVTAKYDSQIMIACMVGSYDVDHETMEANARLIAAAPDLLELVQSFVTDQVDYMTRNKLGDPEQQHNIKWARRLFAQIKGEA